jgi:predicted ATP-grasp superfamily ATP-dependent carboligase
LKPRTQVLYATHSKGRFVERPEALAFNYTDYVAGNRYHPSLAALLPDVRSPMLQAYRPQAATGIYSLSGFVGKKGQVIAARASLKILQRPRGFGVGLCFEETPVDASVLARVLRLCELVGYFGVFEAEFVRDGSRLQLIDFNPRFYGQMAFEIARDLPLAYLVWLGALGEEEALAQELATARQWREGRGYAYCHRFFLEMTLSVQRLSRRMPKAEAERWRSWTRTHAEQALLVDAAECQDDPLPGRVAAFKEIYRAGRHLRSFVRSTVLDSM